MGNWRAIWVLALALGGCSWFEKKTETVSPAVDECVKSDRRFFEFFAATGNQEFTKDEKFLREACMEATPQGQHVRSVRALKDAILRRLIATDFMGGVKGINPDLEREYLETSLGWSNGENTCATIAPRVKAFVERGSLAALIQTARCEGLLCAKALDKKCEKAFALAQKAADRGDLVALEVLSDLYEFSGQMDKVKAVRERIWRAGKFPWKELAERFPSAPITERLAHQLFYQSMILKPDGNELYKECAEAVLYNPWPQETKAFTDSQWREQVQAWGDADSKEFNEKLVAKFACAVAVGDSTRNAVFARLKAGWKNGAKFNFCTEIQDPRFKKVCS